ncbi:DNA methyltransferase [Treponema endosymbiont of Eucomonympha sp.]|uniref:DNA methyltransferase n=1 Tax=Treponema endosymbiont of Eucomonympha sp. TaxID=1580831 RepID=UPI000784D80A|nr:site-specific DNA-methyltransferase [Treponema endosymbiont of Eucomonympha sp.]
MANKNKYADLSREQLEDKLERLERVRYGLVWKDKPEDVADQCTQELPVLVEDKTKEIRSADDPPTHFIIEGDNYHALYTLNFTHQKKIDVIYIDPPYNTGNKSWKYNNNYVDKEDTYRHSKWLSFTNKRLRLCKTLLKNTGIIICAIDDYEFAGLKLLFDQIFGEQNRLGTLTVVHNPGGRQDEKFFPTAHEYMLVYAKNNTKAEIGTLNLSKDKISQYKDADIYGRYKLRGYRRSGANSRKEDRPNLFYPIYISKNYGVLTAQYKEGYITLLPIDDKGIERCWRWNAETFEEEKEKYIEIKNINGEINLYVKERENENTGEKTKLFGINLNMRLLAVPQN